MKELPDISMQAEIRRLRAVNARLMEQCIKYRSMLLVNGWNTGPTFQQVDSIIAEAKET